MIYIIGCGGGGSWLLPKLCKLEPDSGITLIDGDTLEEANLDRQLFDKSMIGINKAMALAGKYAEGMRKGFVVDHPHYFSQSNAVGLDIKPKDWFFACADNHPARKAVIDACDEYGCRSVILGNEYVDAEAYYYEPSMKWTLNDPRCFYPVILTSHEGDPLAAEGCTGAAQEKHPQLVLANDWATGLALQLYWFHTRERSKYPENREFWPIHHRVSAFKFTTIRWQDRELESKLAS